jgi:hypothetical protein
MTRSRTLTTLLMIHLPSTNVFLVVVVLLILLVGFRRCRRPCTTKFNGPPSTNFLFGHSNTLLRSSLHSHQIEEWEIQYGSVFNVPTVLGRKNLVLCDPKAILHLYASDTYAYRQPRSFRSFIENFVSCRKFMLLSGP